MGLRFADQMEVSPGRDFFPCDEKTVKDIFAKQCMENGALAVTLTAEESRVCIWRSS